MDNNVDEFLRKIAKVESSGGTNFNHQQIKSGIQKGDQAIGAFGLMPNTVDEIINRGTDIPHADDILSMDPQEKKKYLEDNPDVEYALARRLASQVLDKQNGDQEKAAFAWNQGHNLSPDQIEKRGYEDSDYVQKFNKVADTPVKKAYQERYPLSIEGSPEASKVASYVGDDSYKGRAMQQLNRDQDARKLAIQGAMASPFSLPSEPEPEPEEADFPPKEDDLNKAFMRLKGYMGQDQGPSKPFLANPSEVPQTEQNRDLEQEKKDAVSKMIMDLKNKPMDVEFDPSGSLGAAGGIRNIAKEAVPALQAASPAVREGAAGVKNFFTKLGILPKTMSAEEFVAKNASNPDVQEVLKDVRKYDPINFRTTQGRANVEASVKAYQDAQELNALKDAAQHMDAPTNVLDDILKRKK